MKWIGFFIVLILVPELYAQDAGNHKSNFIRVYDLEGKKIGRGYIQSSTDTSMIIKREEKTFLFHYENIGSIKTKRSAANNVVIGASIGIVTLGTVGWVTGEKGGDTIEIFNSSFITQDTRPSSAVFSGIAGGILGALVGTLTLTGRKSQEFEILGKLQNWRFFKTEILDNGT